MSSFSPPALRSNNSVTSITSLRSSRSVQSTSIKQNDNLAGNGGLSTILSSVSNSEFSAIESWTDVFEKHPPAQVRVIAYQVRNEAKAKKEQLRKLVGDSYRDLLATADTIISMNDQVNDLEAKVRELSFGCSASTITARLKKREDLENTLNNFDLEHKKEVAIAKTIQDLLFAIQSLQYPQHILVGSKLLLLTTLLVESIHASTLPVIKILKSKLHVSNALHLSRISNFIKSSDASQIPDTLVAFSIFTKSSPSATLSYFLTVRIDQLSGLISQLTPEAVIEAVRIIDDTITQTNSVFPSQISRQLIKSTTHPVLQDPIVKGLPYIDFLIVDRWISANIVEYVPCLPVDNTSLIVADHLTSFTQKSFVLFENGIRSVIEKDGTHDKPSDHLIALIELRKQLFDAFSAYPIARLSLSLTTFAQIWNAQVRNLLRSQLSILSGLIDTLSHLIARARAGDTDKSISLWDDVWMEMDISKGAIDFQKNISSLISGTVGLSAEFVDDFHFWWNQLQQMYDTLSQIPKVYKSVDVDEFDEWVQELKTAADAEYNDLKTLIDDTIIPEGLHMLIGSLRERFQEIRGNKEALIFLIRIVRRIVFVKPISPDLQKELVKIAELGYEILAESIFDVQAGYQQVEQFFTLPVATGIWEEEAKGGRYPFDPSTWVTDDIYSTYIQPIVSGDYEDVVLNVPIAVSVLKKYVGQQWVSGITDGLNQYLQKLDADLVNQKNVTEEKSVPADVKQVVQLELEESSKPAEQGDEDRNEQPNNEASEETLSKGLSSDDKNSIPEASEETNLPTDVPGDDTDVSKETNVVEENEIGCEQEEELDPNALPTMTVRPSSLSLSVANPTIEHWQQLLFDVMYVSKIFAQDVTSLRDVVLARARSGLEISNEKFLEVISKRVEACWQRTHLVYALL
ncbi:hypothetical protein V1514DRAFT_365882 [Lipomyces japonicus]|uniref:uncharacterized protein n=1 Tax=Lipomyces japonicus TaxID=56871 RepID=UPI0034CDD157